MKTIRTREGGSGLWQAWKRNRNADEVLVETPDGQIGWKTSSCTTPGMV
jgi:hypothetical protein